MNKSRATFCFLLMPATLHADYEAGLRAFEAKKYAVALKEWEPLAEQGDTAAQNGLGFLNERGLGVPKDLNAAARWFRVAANRGFGPAEYNLGLLYRRGDGVRQSDVEAIQLFKRAAEHGVGLAELNLGDAFYREGSGDIGEAVRWWRKAAKNGNPVAGYNLAFLYSKGKGVPRNYYESAKWYRMAAEQGYASAQYALGLLYRNGTGVTADPVAARMWLELAARGDVKEAEQDMKVAEQFMKPEQIRKARQMASDWKPVGQKRAVPVGAISAKISDPGPRQAQQPRTIARTEMRTVEDPGPSTSFHGKAATGFLVSTMGHIVTSSGSVAACTDVAVMVGNDRHQVKVIARDPRAGLAIVGPVSGAYPPLALFTEQELPTSRKVAEVGYDLRDDRATLRITTPPNRPSLGGPVLDQSGRVVAFFLIRTTEQSQVSEIPASVVARFLDRHHISYGTTAPIGTVAIGNIGESARKSIVLVECAR